MHLASRPRSVLRSLLPFYIVGQGNMSAFARAAFLQRPVLIHEALGTLESLEDIPTAPRIAISTALQLLIDGEPQRNIRDAFDQADLIARRTLLDYGSGGKHGLDPVASVVLHELRLAAGMYSKYFTPSTLNPVQQGSILARHMLEHDIRRDESLDTLSLVNDSDRVACSPRMWDALAEILKLERDLLGEYRLDMRHGTHYVFHNVKVEDIEKSHETFGLMKMPVVEMYGNFVVKETLKFDKRWTSVEISCRKEDHKIPVFIEADPESNDESQAPRSPAQAPDMLEIPPGMKRIILPNVDEVISDDGSNDAARVVFNKPIIFRDQANASKDHRNGRKFEEQHVATFELASERPKDFEKSLSFMDRYFRSRPNAGVW